jgi:hypothetical protein
MNFSSGDKCLYGNDFYEDLEKIDSSVVHTLLTPNIVEQKRVYRVAYVTLENPKLVNFMLYNGVGEFIEDGVTWIFEKAYDKKN